MPEPVPPLSAFPADLQASYPHAELVWGVLEASLTGLALYTPLRDAQGLLTDFRIDLLNPAAQHILQQPARPEGTYLLHYPHTLDTGVFAFHRDVFESGVPARMQVNYQADGLDNYFQLSARRVGQGLLVSFTDTADASRTEVELALRQSQGQEQAARAEADLQRQQLYNVLHQAPAMICLFEGPAHTFQFVNPSYQALVGERPLIGLPIAQAMSELAGQPIFGLLDQVYRTGETFYANEMLVQLDHGNEGLRELEKRYYNFIYQARHKLDGAIDGIFVFAYDVTKLVLARQQVEQLNEELAATNEELHASNDEYLTANTALQLAQQQLQQLNQELEDRVAERTTQLLAARTETERERARLAQLFTQAPAAICILDGPDLVYELVNPGYQALFPGRELLGKPLLTALPEIADNHVYTTFRQVYDTGHTQEEQALLIPLARPTDGVLEDRYFRYIQQARYAADGRVDGVLVFAFEVTVQVQAHQQAEALQAQVLLAAQRQLQQRATLYQVFAQTPAAICIQRGPEHRYEYANQAYQDFFPGRPLIGQTVAEALPETVPSGVVTLLDHVYQTGETYYGSELPLQIAQPDGSLRLMYFTFTYQAYRENGEIVGISTFAYDVAEQVLARQQREAQQRQLQQVFAQAPVAICVFHGPDYVLELVNPLMGEMLGHAPAHLLGQRFFTALPELTSQGLPALLAQVRHTGRAYRAYEQPLHLARHQPGEVGYFHFVYEPLRDASDHVTGIVCVATEVTEQVRARQQVQDLNEELAVINEELAATNEELYASNEELHDANHQLHDSNTQLMRTNVDLDNFIYTASHDLKQPIANLEGLLLALQHELPAQSWVGEVPTLLPLMQQAIVRFGRTIGHLTDISRLQKEFDQPATPVNLGLVVQEVQLDLIPLINQTEAHMVVAVPEHVTLTVAEKNLRSIVYNLLHNALKYRHADRAPQVALSYQLEGQYHVLTVQDNGLGLDLTQGAERLFGMFQRLHTHVEGSGVGLYMVKRMVENVGGRIEVQSQVEKGTTFQVYFPVP